MVAGSSAGDGTERPEIPWAGTRGVSVPTIRQRFLVSYPEEATRAKIGASLVYQILVRRDGSIEIEKLLGCRVWKWGRKPDEKLAHHCESVGAAVAETLARWTFRPALFEGRPIDVYYELSFDLYKKSGKRPIDVWTEEEREVLRPEIARVDDDDETLAPLAPPSAALPDERAWFELKTPNFTVYSNAPELAARRVGEKLEQLRAVLGQLAGGEQSQAPRPTSIYLFDDDLAFAPYSIGTNVAGYYTKDFDGNFVAFYLSVGFESTLYHEYLHDFVASNLPYVPLWLNEGLAELYSTFTVQDGKAVIGTPRLEFAQMLRLGKLMPLDELFDVTRESMDYNETERTGLFYAQSWALTYYLLLGDATLTPRLATFLEAVGRGEAVVSAFENAFELSHEEVATRLEAYLRAGSYRLHEFDLESLEYPRSVETRSISRAETLSRLGTLLLHTEEEGAQGAEEHFRAALELEPDLAMAHRGLGRALERRGDRARALAELETAKRLDPRDDLVPLTHAKLLLDNEMRERDATGLENAEAWAMSRKLLLEAIELNPARADSYGLLGGVLVRLGDCAAGPAILKKAWQMMPSDLAVATNLALLLGICGETGNAAYIVDTFLDPYAASGDVVRVRHFMHRGEIDAAFAELEAGDVAAARERLQRVVAEAEDPELRAAAESALAELLTQEQGIRWDAAFAEAAAASRADDHARALELLERLRGELDGIGTDRGEGDEHFYRDVIGLSEVVRTRAAIVRARDLADSGRFRESIDALDGVEARIRRFLKTSPADEARRLLTLDLAWIDENRPYTWTAWYEYAAKMGIEGDRETAVSLIREIIGSCPYERTLERARKALVQLTR